MLCLCLSMTIGGLTPLFIHHGHKVALSDVTFCEVVFVHWGNAEGCQAGLQQHWHPDKRARPGPGHLG